MTAQETEMRCKSKRIQEEQEKKIDLVLGEFRSGELQQKIAARGLCDFVFDRLGNTVLAKNKPCEREKGHSGPHMFGVGLHSK